MDGWQGAKVPLDQRLHRRFIKAPDEDECEVARIGKALLVERKRLFEVPFVNHRRR